MKNKEKISGGFKVDELFSVKIKGFETHENENSFAGKRIVENSFQMAIRPFDLRRTPWDAVKVHQDEMNPLLINNIFLILPEHPPADFRHVFVSKRPAGNRMLTSGKDNTSCSFPLFFSAVNSEEADYKKQNLRILNLNKEIISKFSSATELLFVSEIAAGNLCFATANPELQDDFKLVFAPIDLFDYLYAVLHSPAFREGQEELLGKRFPEILYPENSGIFWKLVRFGSRLRQVHLLESLPDDSGLEKRIADYPVDEDNKIGKVVYEKGKVYINREKIPASRKPEAFQYFDNVPENAWNFFVGDYQPAQQWLKDRTGQKLEPDDILHYRKIIAALTETERLTTEMEKIA